MKIQINKSSTKVKVLETIPEEALEGQAFSRHANGEMPLDTPSLSGLKSKYFISNVPSDTCVSMDPSATTSFRLPMPGQLEENAKPTLESFGVKMFSRTLETHSTSSPDRVMQPLKNKPSLQNSSSFAMRSSVGNFSYSVTPERINTSSAFQSKQFAQSFAPCQTVKPNKRKYDSFANLSTQSLSLKSVFGKYSCALPSKKAKLESPFRSQSSMFASLPIDKVIE